MTSDLYTDLHILLKLSDATSIEVDDCARKIF